MFNTIRYFIRSLVKKKTISMITIGGFALSMSVVITLSVFIFNENQVNKGFPHAKNIYRLKLGGQGSNVPKTLMDDMAGKVPGVEKMCLYSMGSALYHFEDQKYFAQFIATNNDFLDIFSFQFIHQAANPTLSIKDNIILTSKFSEKLYGERNPVGETIQINHDFFNIVGVVNDPVNSSFSFDGIINYEKTFSRGGIRYNEEKHEMFKSFVLLHQASNVEEINNRISGMLNHWEAFRVDELSLQPLDQVYFDTESNDDMEHANMEMIYLLTGITAIILIMSIFNYVNLTISQGHERLNEIGIKKATGASKKDIFSQFITESLIVSFFAMTLAILLTSAVAPLFSEILGKNIELHQLFTKSKLILFAIPIILFVGIISGIYPALVVSKVPPIQILKKQKNIGNNNGGLIAIQFMITITLILSLLFIHKQLGYVKNKDLGFDKELMVRLNLNGGSSAKWQVLKNSLLSSPEIISVTASQGAPLSVYFSSTGSFDGIELEDVKGMGVDEDFLKTFGLTLLLGRNFEASDKNVCLINEHLYKQLEWDDFSGKKVFGKTVIGVIKDFHHNNLYHQIGHIQLTKTDEFSPSFLSIKIRNNISEGLKFIQKTFNEIEPGTPVVFDFYDEWVRRLYQKEEKQAYAIKVFSLLAILISCLGLIGMAENITKRKIKEIGIRKVNGAKTWEVISLLNRDFVVWVAIAFVIASPIAWYAMNKWLQNFAYKTELSWWIFALAGLLALGIALLTVSFQSWKAASRNPVESLRYE